MRASYRWLKELSGVDPDVDAMARFLTAAGLEVEGIERFGASLDRVVVAEVRGREKIPERDKLSLVRVFDGTEELDVVCGASNVPDPGGQVLLAQVGAVLPDGMTIGERKLGGVTSRGMICSESELRIGEGSEGIVRVSDLGLGQKPKPGTPAADALALEDATFEIGLTPNRPDCLGHVGLAREIAIAAGRPMGDHAAPSPARVTTDPSIWSGAPVRLPFGSGGNQPEPVKEESVSHSRKPSIAVSIGDAERCPRYAAGFVTGVRVGPSPWWVRYRLFVLGLRAIHNVVDATNLAMLETGHPVHAFDLHRVRGERIHVRTAVAGETMATLDAVDRRFEADDLLICDGEGPVAVAGVMGGANSEIRDETTEVLIECAYFSPRSVRRTSRRLGLHTDASHRFERGVDPNGVPRSLARTVQLVADLGGGVAYRDGLDVYPAPIRPKQIAFRSVRSDRVLGFATEPKEAKRLFEWLGCHVREEKGAMAVEVPTWRPDLEREEDLIEEVARLRGYDQVPVAVPHVRPSAVGDAPEVSLTRRLREAAADAGLFEAVTYAFISPDDLARARVQREAVAIVNPLSEERSVLRTSLLPGLVAAARHSSRRQVAQIQLFELARTYHRSTDALPVEKAALGFLLAGPRRHWVSDDEAMDFYDGKGVVEYLVEAVLGQRPTAIPLPDDCPYLHPRRAAAFEVQGQKVGWAGELHPEVSEETELSGRPIYGELDVDRLAAISRGLGAPQARDLPRFPAATRDLALVVEETERVGEIAETLIEAGEGLIENADLFDLYRGDSIPQGAKSLAFRVIYRHRERTLTDKEVDRLHGRVQKAACQRHRATVR